MNVYEVSGLLLRKHKSPNGEEEECRTGLGLPRTFWGRLYVVINARYAYSSERLKRNVSISGEYAGFTFETPFSESVLNASKEAVCESRLVIRSCTKCVDATLAVRLAACEAASLPVV